MKIQSAPRLETERLILRAHTLDDFADLQKLWSDPDVVRFISGSPMSREMVWARLLQKLGHWQAMGFGYFAIEDKQSGRFIGEAGFHDMHRSLEPSIEGTLEAGWAFFPHRHGKGYATEAVSAAMDWASRTLPPIDFTCIIDPSNTASRRVADKLGFVDDSVTTYNGQPTVILRKPPQM